MQNKVKNKATDFTIRTDEESFNLESNVRLIGEDLLVAVWGGEKPHIGAVAIAQPRPSLQNSTSTSASTSVFCFIGHKEDEIAKSIASELAGKFGKNVVVTAGMHWDDLDENGIKKITDNCKKLTRLILTKIKESD